MCNVSFFFFKFVFDVSGHSYRIRCTGCAGQKPILGGFGLTVHPGEGQNGHPAFVEESLINDILNLFKAFVL